jgi:argininosuccinate lyase
MSSSSIMPQKRNPDGAELIRAKASIAIGNLSSNAKSNEVTASDLQ